MKCLQVCFLSSAYQQNFFVQYENELLLCSCFENDGQLKKKKTGTPAYSPLSITDNTTHINWLQKI